MSLLILLALIGGSHAILCYDDFELENVQDYTYKLEKSPHDKFWSKYVKPDVDKYGRDIPAYNNHLTYTLFGRFDGDPSDATITAGYYKADDSLIYSVKVDCGSRTWTSYAPNLENPLIEDKYQEGELDESCADGEIFDVILKVQQAHLMNWLYNGQPLQKGNQTIDFLKKGVTPDIKIRTHYVPSPDARPTGGAGEAAKMKIKTTGAAVLTRLAFGRCIAWPEEITRNCSAVNEWILKRSKSKTAGVGLYGFSAPTYTMDCYTETLFFWFQAQIHPDEDSEPESAYCCCVNMETGKLFTGEKATDCQSTQDCNQGCTDAFDPELYTEEGDEKSDEDSA